MLLGLDITATYPILAVIFILFLAFFSYRLFRNVSKVAKDMQAISKQFGTNGGSTLRQEFAALSNYITEVRDLLLAKVKEDKVVLGQQNDALAAQDKALAQLQGLVTILQRTMSDMGLDNQIRKLLEAYVQKDIATTTLNVMQATTDSHQAGGVSASDAAHLAAGADVTGGNILRAGDDVTIERKK
jgi:hypothetical protein